MTRRPARVNFTSTWTWWPGSGFSHRVQRLLWRTSRWETGSRFISRRLRIRQTPDGLMVMSW